MRFTASYLDQILRKLRNRAVGTKSGEAEREREKRQSTDFESAVGKFVGWSVVWLAASNGHITFQLP